jgi:hypothetical protein
MANNHGTLLFTPEQQKIFDTFTNMSGIEIEKTDPDLSWIKDMFVKSTYNSDGVL